MKTLLLVLATAGICVTASARPVVVESVNAVPSYTEDYDFAGDELISSTWQPVNTEPEQFLTSASLYRRGSNGKWTFTRKIVAEQSFDPGAAVGLSTTVAAVATSYGLRVWERSTAGWTEAKVAPAARTWGTDVDVVGNTILMSTAGCSAQAFVITRGTNGVWGVTAALTAPAGGCIDNIDLDEGRAIVHVDYTSDAQDSVIIFERSGSIWSAVATFLAPAANTGFGRSIALRGTLAVVSESIRGAHVYRRTSAGWQAAGYLVNPDSYNEGQLDVAIDISDGYVVKVAWNINRRTSVVNVFRRAADETFEHVAILAGTATNGPTDVRIEGSRVMALEGTAPHEFNLPSSFDVPALVQEDFQTGVAANWTPIAGSQFSLVSNGQTRVYRQSSVAGDAGSIYSVDYANQNVSADVRPIAFNGNDRWVGLVTRYTDAGNYYYITLRSTGLLVLKRMLNGVNTELATYPVDASLQWHRLGLESSGTRHAVYVDGVLVTYAFDSAHTHGRAGIRTYRASADFDNVVVSPGPLAALTFTDRVTAGGSWSATWTRGADSFSQTQPDINYARAASGLPREDVSVQARLTLDAFSSSGTPWAGLMVRYEDSRNFYYVAVRADQITLRKMTNGVVTVLDSEKLATTVGVPLNLRLEAIGDRLRVYVNDELRMERSGAEVVPGKAGAVTYRAAATYLNYLAIEP